MNLPGFVADASLHRMTNRPQAASSFPRLDKTIYPAQQWEWEQTDLGSLDTESVRTYGTVPPGEEDAFQACITQCRAGRWHPTYSACQRTCCKQFTGYYACVNP